MKVNVKINKLCKKKRDYHSNVYAEVKIILQQISVCIYNVLKKRRFTHIKLL